MRGRRPRELEKEKPLARGVSGVGIAGPYAVRDEHACQPHSLLVFSFARLLLLLAAWIVFFRL